MDNARFTRTIDLIGEDYFNNIQNKKIYVAGLGGVGGTAFEALVRTGFSHFVIVDKDVVDITNLNRQLLFTENDLSRNKVDIALERAKSINPNIDIKTIKDDALKKLPGDEIDFIVDCIDDVKAKVKLLEHACNKNIPVITSTGMANKLDPSKIKVSSLNKSTMDPLAKKLRYELKQANVDISNIACVYSEELPQKDGTKLNSIITVTSTAGLLIANYVLNFFKKILR